MNTTLALMIAGALSLGTVTAANADTTTTIRAIEDRAEKLAAALTVFDKTLNNVVVVIARGDVGTEITNVQSVTADGRMLTLEYQASDGQNYRAAVDASDVLLVQERPREE